MLSEVPTCWVKYHHTSAEMQETSEKNNNDTKYGFPRFGHCASFFWVRHFSWLERESRLCDNFPPPMEIRRRSKEDWHFGSIRLDSEEWSVRPPGYECIGDEIQKAQLYDSPQDHVWIHTSPIRRKKGLGDCPRRRFTVILGIPNHEANSLNCDCSGLGSGHFWPIWPPFFEIYFVYGNPWGIPSLIKKQLMFPLPPYKLLRFVELVIFCGF